MSGIWRSEPVLSAVSHSRVLNQAPSQHNGTVTGKIYNSAKLGKSKALEETDDDGVFAEAFFDCSAHMFYHWYHPGDDGCLMETAPMGEYSAARGAACSSPCCIHNTTSTLHVAARLTLVCAATFAVSVPQALAP